MPPQLVSFLGLAVIISCTWAISRNRRVFPWRTVAWGLGLQCAFALLILKTSAGVAIFEAAREATGKIAPFTREQAAAARVAQEDARSDKLPVRRLGQRNLPSVLRAGWNGVEAVDRHQKSRSPSQGGANIDTQAVLSPGLLKARIKAQEERARRRHFSPDARSPTPRESPCAKAFTSIKTMTMLGYDYRVVNGMQHKDGHVWRYTPPPKPFTPPTPVHLHTSPRSKMSNASGT